MGAGSAKGVNPENSEDADGFSTSSDQWENEVAPTSKVEREKNAKNNNNTHPAAAATNTHSKIITEAAIASTSSTNKAPPHSESVGIEAEEKSKKEEAKKKARFGFSRKKEDGDDNKIEDLGKENESNKKEDNAKKEAEKKGFRIFNWSKKDEKKSEKDEALDDDINDLEKTFDSLGIVGKNTWGNETTTTSKKKEGTVDDIELLEPMRKRKNAKTKGMNGKSSSCGSNGSSKRTFKFSWETDGDKTTAKEEVEGEWEYKAVVIEGFDIEKFRKANNLTDSVFDNTSLPNTVG
ncbi:hypothetical protein Pcinc_003850 [Petrolisthes cinctipes]|uniref:Uncharacterized protein n=1 Tax=Petrolisthes cinctipes TaxID=88211 RepID=A0AAE1GMP4_PETCI|nr:hypothetical protein Pcinc_003850 [Petrolisthes cinctipes]